jgi:hypothetical protein
MNTPGTTGTSISRTILNTHTSTTHTHKFTFSGTEEEMPVPPVPLVPPATPERELYSLTLRPLPGWPTPGWQRLRAALKCCLRSFGLRCETVRPGPLDNKEQSRK